MSGVATSRQEIRVRVDPSNPGQFFACCGLLELADRLWPGAEGWFAEGMFHIGAAGGLAELIVATAQAELTQLDREDAMATRIQIGAPFRPLRLDWWRDGLAGGRELKVWAGSMESYGILAALQWALRDERFHSPDMLNIQMVVSGPDNKKKEPYYFDGCRAPNSHSRDVGFSPNDVKMATTAFPAVELFCLIGLQRCLPARTQERRIFDYYSWSQPLPPELLAPVVAGQLKLPGARGYRFETWFRTGQKKHKAFRFVAMIS